MPRRRGLPPYRFHKHTGQALVHVQGRDVYLGPHGSEESKRKYEEIVRKILANQASADAKHRVLVADTLTVRELIPKYLAHARSYYQKNGRLTSEYQSICSALRPLREQCEVVLARNFGPKHLKQFPDRPGFWGIGRR